MGLGHGNDLSSRENVAGKQEHDGDWRRSSSQCDEPAVSGCASGEHYDGEQQTGDWVAEPDGAGDEHRGSRQRWDADCDVSL